MGSTIVLILFCLCLVACMAAGLPLFAALAIGYVLFVGYGLRHGQSIGALLKGSLDGIRSVAGILVAFVFIGMLTASWRASGTIPAIVTDCLYLVSPAAFPLAAFVMTSVMSLLTGTCFGTAATMGSICMALGLVLGCHPVLVGGAVLSGCYVGDRNSPLSTASLLVAQVTNTSFTHNLALMAKRAVLPALLCCALYLALGFAFPTESAETNMALPYAGLFDMSWITLIPALSVLLLAFARADIRLNMAISTTIAIAIALSMQHADPASLARQLVFGYEAPSLELARTLNGGGILSMLQPGIIVMISSTYAGLFEMTDLLDGLKSALRKLSGKIGKTAAMAVGALPLCGLCCNQTLSTVLSQQLFGDQYPEDGQDLALDIEDTSIVISGLIPWSIACSVPLTTAGAPMLSVIAAFYLVVQPICTVIRANRRS